MADDAVFTIETNLERWLLSVRRESGVRADVSDAGVGRASADVREPAAYLETAPMERERPLREIDDGNAHTASHDAIRSHH